jgi:hypothetical protein
MSKHTFAIVAAVVLSCGATAAHAQRVRGAYENAAGGVTAGGAQDVRGPFGGRAVGEGGVVTDGDGSGIAGSRGCARTGAGGRGCGARGTTWDEDGNVRHEQSGYAQGAFGNTASTQGSFERDEDGDWSGSRNSEVNVGDRTYSADTSFSSEDGWDRDVDCSGSGCPD